MGAAPHPQAICRGNGCRRAREGKLAEGVEARLRAGSQRWFAPALGLLPGASPSAPGMGPYVPALALAPAPGPHCNPVTVPCMHAWPSGVCAPRARPAQHLAAVVGWPCVPMLSISMQQSVFLNLVGVPLLLGGDANSVRSLCPCAATAAVPGRVSCPHARADSLPHLCISPSVAQLCINSSVFALSFVSTIFPQELAEVRERMQEWRHHG